MSIPRFTTACLALALSLSATAAAASVPFCSPSSATAECRVSIENAHFEQASSRFSWGSGFPSVTSPAWEKLGDADGQLSFAPDQMIFQMVHAPATADNHAMNFVPQLRVRSEGGEATVRLKVQVLDGPESPVVFSRDYVVDGEWSTPSGGFVLDQVPSSSTTLAITVSRVDTNAAASLKLDKVRLLRQRLASEE
ncbi:hypothetical protein IM816_04380 [Luteibacter flocculans]|uniref:Uncharacterized protein n=1 Tax=Luteibacter flocculans TaxID=2780091 RepID=A0ABY4T367_9GAMM|nr:hypothetical protein [Luteibacter flocculans]URL59354.1 hypothetical protein IM816_04380 [Luteibacter flocculans]